MKNKKTSCLSMYRRKISQNTAICEMFNLHKSLYIVYQNSCEKSIVFPKFSLNIEETFHPDWECMHDLQV